MRFRARSYAKKTSSIVRTIWLCLASAFIIGTSATFSPKSVTAEPLPPATPQTSTPTRLVRIGSAPDQPLKTSSYDAFPFQQSSPALAGTAAVSVTTQLILYEGFEGAFPNTLWYVVDQSADGKDRKWDDVSYQYHEGGWSVWPAAGGFDGRIPQPDDDKYFSNMDTWMRYGPFDLSDAEIAGLFFSSVYDIRDDDRLWVLGSTDGLNFSAFGYINGSSNNSWSVPPFVIDLQNFVGEKRVYIAFEFATNASGTGRGPYLDEITILKNVATQNVRGGPVYLPFAARIKNTIAGCDSFEPNDGTSSAKGPLASNQTYSARMCSTDKEDFYYFNATKAGTVSLTLNLPASLYPEATLYLYPPDVSGPVPGCYNAPPTGGRTGSPVPVTASCNIPSAGKYLIRINSKGTSNPANSYTFKVVYP